MNTNGQHSTEAALTLGEGAAIMRRAARNIRARGRYHKSEIQLSAIVVTECLMPPSASTQQSQEYAADLAVGLNKSSANGFADFCERLAQKCTDADFLTTRSPNGS